MTNDANNRGNPTPTLARGLAMVARGKCCFIVGLAIAFAPICAHAQSAQPPFSLPVKAPPMDGYLSGGPFASWLDMVSATQAQQPHWMTPLVTVTPRLEQEFRADYYHQQNGTAN
jgi:hypothetical protein